MRAYLALFDPASSTTEGTFWSWHSAELDVQFLDHLYYDFAKVLRPEDPNSLQMSDIVGGFLCESGWIAAYRFGNGGRDRHGRPGRFVLVVTAVTTDTARDCNLQSLLTCPETEKILRQAAKECPVPPPAKLWVDLPHIPARRDPRDLATFWNHGRWLCQSQDALQRLTNLLGLLTEHGPWAAEVQVSRKANRVALRHLQPALLKAHQSVAFRGTGGIHAYSFPPRRAHTVSSEPRNFKDRLQLWLFVGVLIITHMLAFSAGLVSSRLLLPHPSSSEAVREGTHGAVVGSQPPAKQQTDVKAQESQKPRGSADSTPRSEGQVSSQSPGGNPAADSAKQKSLEEKTGKDHR